MRWMILRFIVMRSASIRWRLPLSYAGIALVAALVLGLVLITTLRSYYAQREYDYLTDNARAISILAADFDLLAQTDETLETQLQSMAFLSQTRMRVLDANEVILTDTGSPNDLNLVDLRYDRLRISPALTGAEIAVQPARSDPSTTDSQQTQSLNPPMPPRFEGETRETFKLPEVVIINSTAAAADPEPYGPTDDAQAYNFWIRAAEPEPASTGQRPMLAATRALFGFNFGPAQRHQNPSGATRSDQVVQVDIRDAEGQLQGYVQLSEGPAYGMEIVTGVAEAWVLASLIAVVLAAGMGLVVSQRISAPLVALKAVTVQMSSGDLTARAQVTGQDEVGILAGSFNEMANRVEETITTLRRFVADAAHELHTPLTALRTNLELVGTEANQARRELFLERAQAQVMRLETLTTDLLELSRLETSVQQASNPVEQVNLTELICETSEFYASRAEQAGLDFALTLPDQPIYARVNAGQLCRALDNLLGNALKFTPQGGTISMGLCQHNDQIELWVQDTGIGIPDDDLPQLFNRFHRGRNASNFPGSGLGLAIVKAIADYHHGQVTVENRSPGARLSLWLPV